MNMDGWETWEKNNLTEDFLFSSLKQLILQMLGLYGMELTSVLSLRMSSLLPCPCSLYSKHPAMSLGCVAQLHPGTLSVPLITTGAL